MDISEAKGMLDEFISQTNEMDSRGRGMVCLTNGQHTTKDAFLNELGLFMMYVVNAFDVINSDQGQLLDLVMDKGFANASSTQIKTVIAALNAPDPEDNASINAYVLEDAINTAATGSETTDASAGMINMYKLMGLYLVLASGSRNFAAQNRIDSYVAVLERRAVSLRPEYDRKAREILGKNDADWGKEESVPELKLRLKVSVNGGEATDAGEVSVTVGPRHADDIVLDEPGELPEHVHEHYTLVTSGSYTSHRDADFRGQPIRGLMEKCGATREPAYQLMKIDNDEYDLDRTALKLAQVFRLNEELFDPYNDTEALIRKSMFKDVRALHALRSMAWAVGRITLYSGDSPANISFGKLEEIAGFIAERNCLAYSLSHAWGLNGHEDWHVFYTPDQYLESKVYTQTDLRYLTGKENRGGNSSFMILGGDLEAMRRMTAINSLISRNDETVKSLEELREVLVELKPVMETIHDGLLEGRDRSEKLEGILPDVLTAWCALAVAAKEPFYSEEAANTPEAHAGLEGPLERPHDELNDRPVRGNVPAAKKTVKAGKVSAKPSAEPAVPEKPESVPAKSVKSPDEELAERVRQEIEKDPDGSLAIRHREMGYRLRAIRGRYEGKPQASTLAAIKKENPDINWEDIAYYLPRQFGMSTTDYLKAAGLIKSGKGKDASASGDLPEVPAAPRTAPVCTDGVLDMHGRTAIEEYECASFKAEGQIVIPEGITEIRYGAFSCSAMQSVILPKSLKKIGAWAFYNCRNLKEIRIQEGVEQIGLFTFSKCENLTEVHLPESAIKVARTAFCGGTEKDSGSHITLHLSARLAKILEEDEYLPDLDTMPVGALVIDGNRYESWQDYFSRREAMAAQAKREQEEQRKREQEKRRVEQERREQERREQELREKERRDQERREQERMRQEKEKRAAEEEKQKRRDMLQRQIRSLEEERDAAKGLFAGMKRKKIQAQIDELKEKLRRI